MAELEAGNSLELPPDLDEEGHHFDFIAFYRKAEFCDRVIQLEVLEESGKDSGGSGAAWPQKPSSLGPLVASSAVDLFEEIPLSSIVVGAKSRVLKAMISSGLKESDKRMPITVKVTPKEKAAFKEMLRFLYAGSLSPQFQPPDANVRELVQLLLVGDKFEVPSFMGAVLKSLSKTESNAANSTVLALEIPDTLQQRPEIKRFVEKARAKIVDLFKDVTAMWSSPEFRRLSLGVVEILLQSEELEADSEEEILDKLLDWVWENFKGLTERRDVLEALSQHIRFCCMRGEYLESLLSVPEMYSKATKSLIKAAMRFQSYSDEKKQSMYVEACERKGVQDTHLEIVASVRLEEGETEGWSGFANWYGRQWFFGVHENVESNVQILLYVCEPETQRTLAGLTDVVDYSFYVRTWPSGFWQLLFRHSTPLSMFEGAGQGSTNGLGIPWAEARQSTKYISKTGEMTIKVVARRLKSKS